MLKGIWIENFKSYHTGQLFPLAPLTLMIGANASGKSNAIEAFRFLSWYVGGENLSTIQNRINDSERIFRGDIRDLFYFQSNSFTLGVNSIGIDNQYRVVFKKDKNNIDLLTKNEVLRLGHEDLILLETENDDKISLSMIDSEEKINKTILPIGYDKRSSILRDISNFTYDNYQLYSFIDKNIIDSVYCKIMEVIDYINNTYFFDFIPSQMRQESLAEFKLRPNGQNLSGVLYALWQYHPHQEDILKFIKRYRYK